MFASKLSNKGDLYFFFKYEVYLLFIPIFALLFRYIIYMWEKKVKFS